MPIPTTRPVTKVSAKERAYQQVREWIIDGTLEPGEKLAEVELAGALSISRTPIREALQQLAGDGFVIMQTGLTTQVAPLDFNAAAAIYQPIAAIEGLAAQLAAPKITDQQLAGLTQIDQHYQQVAKQQDTKKELQIDRQFHQQILAIADNAYVSQFSNFMYNHVMRFETFFFKQQQHQVLQLPTHQQLLTALTNHDATTAAQAMKADWLDTLAQIEAVRDN